ncbi:hypothetical protein MBCUT_07050 [Methanobrevibacter cuticularis]|uniref:Toxin HigB-2 n=1 Tax=Methanobrevibacter cuticularis TaxID=47311 RepID=A0A166CTA1_9EURY|nr:hypothetical protein [Methanobrevibacter cuticularis]KZX16667.1 hypothetical protein MBCUT_07050 [Methanobrevibacter cuticularis]
MMTNYVCECFPKFNDEQDDLLKKCKSLKDDVERFKISLIDNIERNNGEIPVKKNSLVHVNGIKSPLPIFKVKKFRCKGIPKGNRSGFRLIFAYDRSVSLIYFIQIYYKKNDNTEMDRKRAKKACDFICDN